MYFADSADVSARIKSLNNIRRTFHRSYDARVLLRIRCSHKEPGVSDEVEPPRSLRAAWLWHQLSMYRKVSSSYLCLPREKRRGEKNRLTLRSNGISYEIVNSTLRGRKVLLFFLFLFQREQLPVAVRTNDYIGFRFEVRRSTLKTFAMPSRIYALRKWQRFPSRVRSPLLDLKRKTFIPFWRSFSKIERTAIRACFSGDWNKYLEDNLRIVLPADEFSEEFDWKGESQLRETW